MKHNFKLKASVWNAKPWIFDWDDESGKISGPNASDILEILSWGGVSAHPLPWAWKFSNDPLKNKTDMAAAIGWQHQLPDELVDYYPRPQNQNIPEKTAIGKDGIVVIGDDQMTY